MAPVADLDARASMARWLCSPESAEPLSVAESCTADFPRDPLAAGTALRRRCPELDGAHAAAALEQADLRHLAAERYGLAAGDLLLSRAGLEQATRPEIATRRAALLQAAGVRHVVDASAGLGFDTRAFLSAGLTVTAVECDSAVAALLQHNCPAAEVVVADVTDAGVLEGLLARLAPTDVVFVDPARRDPAGPRDPDSGRARPERDPARWSPSWPFVAGILHPRVAAKVAPGFAPPEGWHAEWTSVDRRVVECSVYSWPVFAASRRAVLMTAGRTQVVDAHPCEGPQIAAAPGRWLHEPDPAVSQASAVPALAAAHPGLLSLGPGSSWLTSDDVPDAGAALRSYRVLAELSGSEREQRRQLAERGVTRLTVKSRDVDVEPRDVLRRLSVAEGAGHVLVLTRLATRAVSLLAEPAVPRSA